MTNSVDDWMKHQAIAQYPVHEQMYISTTTSVEAKALCSVLRKVEQDGERKLVDTIIEICDPQSGLRFEQVWDWWKKHKAEDALKKAAQVGVPFQQVYDPTKVTVIC